MIDALTIVSVLVFFLLYIDLSQHRKKMLRDIEHVKQRNKKKEGGEQNAFYG